jgi:anti-anti-sigma factor
MNRGSQGLYLMVEHFTYKCVIETGYTQTSQISREFVRKDNSMNIGAYRKGSISILNLKGRIVGVDSTSIKNAIDNQVNDARDGKPKILLNFAEVSFIDSTGIGVIVGSHISITQKGGRIALLHLGENIKNLMVMVKLIRVFECYDDEQDAIASLAKE